MLDKLSMQQRILIATVLSFGFFIGYDYFFIPKRPIATEQNSTQSKEVQQSTPQSAPIANKAPSSAPSTNTPPTTKVDTTEYIATIKSKHFDIKIDSLGRVGKYFLKDEKFVNKDDGSFVQLIEPTFSPKPLEIRFSDTALNSEAFKVSYKANKPTIELEDEKQTLILTQELPTTTITKTITFYPQGNYDLHVKVSTPNEYFISPGTRPNLAVDGYTFHGVLVEEQDETLSVIDDGDLDKTTSFQNAPIAAAADRYYTTFFYDFSKGMDVVLTQDSNELIIPFIKGSQELNTKGYLGPKDHKDLENINPRLLKVIEYGWFTFIAKPVFLLLNYIHGIIGNWGWAIVIMTFFIRLILFPLTYKGMVSMNKLKELSPKIKELQAKYKGEPQKLNAHMMELYKKHGANPMGGCLPILLQIPVFFAIYRVLQNAIELKAAPWILWVEDLSIMDPYFILPVAMGVTMFIHQRITPTNFTDPMQEKIMKFLPLIFTFFFVTFPAGLTLYWFTNNLFSIAQQMYVNKLFDKNKEEAKKGKK